MFGKIMVLLCMIVYTIVLETVGVVTAVVMEITDMTAIVIITNIIIKKL
jgi:hypothetical protein